MLGLRRQTAFAELSWSVATKDLFKCLHLLSHRKTFRGSLYGSCQCLIRSDFSIMILGRNVKIAGRRVLPASLPSVLLSGKRRASSATRRPLTSILIANRGEIALFVFQDHLKETC